MEEIVCETCGSHAMHRPGQIRAAKHHYCSTSCARQGQRKERTTTYRMLTAPDHPLATKGPLVPEHRVLLFDAIGWGPHPCYWCKAPVNWAPGKRTAAGSLVVDHLDGDITNNDLSNLAPTCQSCNGTRWHRVGDDELFITRANGDRIRAIRRTCATCGRGFLAMAYVAKRPNKGLYCSLSCARKAPRSSSTSPPATDG